MESVGSNSPEPAAPRRRAHHKLLSQAHSERLTRALRPGLLLLHRSSESTFFVMGSTSNVYTVVLSATPTCTCPDRVSLCKHIFFVLIRVLGVPVDDPSLRRSTLRPCHLTRLLSAPTSPDSLAQPSLRRCFHQLSFSPNAEGTGPSTPRVEADDGACCPVCLEEMSGGGRKLVACRRCRNPVHDDCLLRWKRSLGRRWASCVICRARWRNNPSPTAGKYLNLAPYLSQEDAAVDGGCTTAPAG